MGDPIQEHEMTRYLLGDLPEEDRERFDELSVCDDEFATRLTALENDLLDAYVREELDEATQQRFEARYLATAARRDRVQMARLLYQRESRSRTTAAQGKFSSQGVRRSTLPWLRALAERPLILGGVLAMAALLALSTGWLAISNYRLLRENLESRAAYYAEQQREQQLAHQLAAAPTSTSNVESNAKNVIGSFLLSPQMRGASELQTIVVQKDTGSIQLRLQLESDDFSQYKISLRSLKEGRFVWLSGNIESTTEGDVRIVSILVPAGLLNTQNYSVELMGIQPGGHAEVIASYPFHAVKKSSR